MYFVLKCGCAQATRDNLHYSAKTYVLTRMTIQRNNTAISGCLLFKRWAYLKTSTVYWCVASKWKAMWICFWMNNIYLWVGLYLFNIWIIIESRRGLLNMVMMQIRGLVCEAELSLIARFMGPTWGPNGTILAPWTLLSGIFSSNWHVVHWMHGGR